MRLQRDHALHPISKLFVQLVNCKRHCSWSKNANFVQQSRTNIFKSVFSDGFIWTRGHVNKYCL